MGVLAKKVQDPNVVVLGLVLDAICKLANGLKKAFAQYRHAVIPSLIERMKENKKTGTLI